MDIFGVQPKSIAELIIYVDRHKQEFGFSPAAIFWSEELQEDAANWMRNLQVISDPDALAKTVTMIYGVRILQKE